MQKWIYSWHDNEICVYIGKGFNCRVVRVHMAEISDLGLCCKICSMENWWQLVCLDEAR